MSIAEEKRRLVTGSMDDRHGAHYITGKVEYGRERLVISNPAHFVRTANHKKVTGKNQVKTRLVCTIFTFVF
jgi:hypothetical protein